ncbi:MAG: hypothetical protein CEE40_11450 [Chloroflexi bacterium B3_Chlor]|nr:MAG: hypothetical protein CEE40_11450 [Chloroflexi bacterium B3_Chlor]
MTSSQRVKAILVGLFLVFALVLASCGPLPARVDTSELEAVVGVRHGMEINLEDVPPTGVPVLCHGQAPAGVASIELYVNGMFFGRSSNTAAPGTHGFNYFTAEMSFAPDGPGAYELRCRTHDQEGRTVNSADVTIFLIGEVPTSPTVPPEIPTATPTSTEAPPPEVPTDTPTATGVPTDTPTSTARPTDTPTNTPTSTPTTPLRPVTIVSFEVNPSTVTPGGCAHFTWRVEGDVTEIWFDGEGVGNYPDSRDRCPTATRAYELHAEGPPGAGSDTESLTVVVAPGDTEGPSITNVDPIKGGQICVGTYCTPADRSLDISAVVTDLSGVSSVEFYCTVPGGSEAYCGPFVRSGGNNWLITYTPLKGVSSGTLTYRIKATDNSPRRNVSWWGTGYIQVFVGIG